MLDLNGGGITTSGINPAAPLYFDHAGDGLPNATGWVGAGEGLVVRDLNGNGLIDSGRELFGDNTVLTTGPNVGKNATDGFAALRDLDSNADGKFDASDAAFSSVKIWTDTNGDAISQTGELHSFADLGLQSISLTATASNINLVDSSGAATGNTQTFAGSFTRVGGATGAAATAELVGNLLLSSNNFYRQFNDDPALTPAALALPGMQGSGGVRDLRPAMSLGTPEATALQTKLAAFAAGTTRDAQLAHLDDLLTAWAETSGKLVHSVGTYGVGTDNGAGVTSDLVMGPNGQTDIRILIDGGYTGTPAQWESVRRINVLEVFNGTKFIRIPPVASSGGGGGLSGGGGGSGGGSVADPYTHYKVAVASSQLDFIDQSYDALKDSIYSALVVQTRLKPYLDSIELVIDASGISFNTTAMGALLDTRKTSDERNAVIDLVELNRYTSPTLVATGFDGLGKLSDWVHALPGGSPLRTELASMNVFVDAATAGSGQRDIYLGDTGANVFSAGEGDDLVRGGAGSDTLYGGLGDDYLEGNAGVDTLYGGEGNDTLDGGSGNDDLYGGVGNNVYLFGKGDGQDNVRVQNDGTPGKLNTLQFKAGVLPSEVSVKRVYGIDGGANSALELSIAGGTDKITVNGFFYGDDPGNANNTLQQVKFADGTTWDIAALVAKVFAGSAADETLVGTAGADTINGLAGADTLIGHGGNDVLNGGADNDMLYGEGGDDTLDGGSGNDDLYGGVGNNTYLFGKGDGQDNVRVQSDGTPGKLNTLQFKAGVSSSEVSVKRVYGIDGGANSALELSIAGGTDRITVNGFFYGDDPGNVNNPLQQVKFADGTIWDIAALVAKALAGSAADDTLIGTPGADTINGLAGADTLIGHGGNDVLNGGADNDTLYGEGGDDTLNGGDGNDQLQGGDGVDTLDGGSGNDLLNGGMGNNTYLFGRGDGQDTISSLTSDATAGKLNTLRFKSGVAPSDIVLKQAPDSEQGPSNWALQASIVGTTDKITINSFFRQDNPGNDCNGVQRFVFEDGTVWDIATLTAKVFAGSASADSIYGTTANDTLNGLAGDDTLIGRAGNDVLNGGDGNDTIYGELGDDTLNGGAGNDFLQADGGADTLNGGDGNDQLQGGDGVDTLDGGSGNDLLNGGMGNNTYLFGRGDGQDTISSLTSDSTAGKLNTLRFKSGVAPSDIVLKQAPDSEQGPSNWALQASIVGTTDKITINSFFRQDNPGNDCNGVQRFVFEDGTVWDIATLTAKVFAGSASADSIYGTTANDTINGLAGDDTLIGRAGNDVLNGGDGNDTIYGEVGNDTLNGGAGNDLLQGDDGDDTLNGGVGTDTMIGGAGNDTYVLDVAADVVTEAANAGTDTVQIGVAYTLGANVENLSLTGSSAVNGTGNTLNNVLTGNSGNNTLTGAAGSDTLDGGAGVDTLVGGTGNDTYKLGRGHGGDTIQENDATAGNTDVLQCLSGIAVDQLWFRKVSNNLEVSIIGTSDKATLTNWYLGSQYHVEQFKTSNGKTLLDSQVQNLVSAMAAFSPPAAGQTTLSAAYQTALNPVIAANWH